MGSDPLRPKPQHVDNQEQLVSQNRRNVVDHLYIALGSNMGDRICNIEDACEEMRRRGINILRTSNLYETEPMYYEDQNRFLNGVCEVC